MKTQLKLTHNILEGFRKGAAWGNKIFGPIYNHCYNRLDRIFVSYLKYTGRNNCFYVHVLPTCFHGVLLRNIVQ